MKHITLSFFDVDLVIIILAYLLVSYGETGAGIFAISQGLLIDIFSVGQLGLFTFLYLALFLAFIIGSRLFDLHSQRGQILIISLAVFLKEILFITLLKILSLEIIVSFSVFFAFVTSAIFSGLIGPFIFYLFNHLNQFYMGRLRGISDERI